jgi:hypothetical protein
VPFGAGAGSAHLPGEGGAVIRHCHWLALAAIGCHWLALAGIGWHCLGIYTVILLTLPSFSARMAVPPWATLAAAVRGRVGAAGVRDALAGVARAGRSEARTERTGIPPRRGRVAAVLLGLYIAEGALSFVTAICGTYRDSPYKREWGTEYDRRPSSKRAGGGADLKVMKTVILAGGVPARPHGRHAELS